MTFRHLAAILLCMGARTCGSDAHAGTIPMPPPGPARVANADAVIVGRVESLEPLDIKVGTTTYRIAVVKINDSVRGVKAEKTLRIGFVPIIKPKDDGKGPFVIQTGARPVQLIVGQEGLFILQKQAKEDFYTIGGVVGYYINRDKNKDFDKEVQVAKAAVEVMKNPQTALKSKNADVRLLAASILIEEYRSFRAKGGVKEAPIDADESKLIMKALADGDWKGQWNFNSLRPSPGQLFQRLGVTKADGFAPLPGGDYQAAAQKWVRDNAEKYNIKRLVPAQGKAK